MVSRSGTENDKARGRNVYATSHQKYHHFDLDDLWSLTHWPHLKSDEKTLPGLFRGYLVLFADLF